MLLLRRVYLRLAGYFPYRRCSNCLDTNYLESPIITMVMKIHESKEITT